MIPSKPSPTLKDPSKHSPEFNDFLAKCVEKNPELRPKAEELLNASFLFFSYILSDKINELLLFSLLLLPLENFIFIFYF